MWHYAERPGTGPLTFLPRSGGCYPEMRIMLEY